MYNNYDDSFDKLPGGEQLREAYKAAKSTDLMARDVGFGLIEWLDTRADVAIDHDAHKPEDVDLLAAKNGIKMLVGERGVGKSACLVHAELWARENGWIVWTLPRAFYMQGMVELFPPNDPHGVGVRTGTGTASPIQPSPSYEGMFAQPFLAQDMLNTMKKDYMGVMEKLPQQIEYPHQRYQVKSGTPTLAHIIERGRFWGRG